ncbi:MAG: hypothetical protein ACLSAF_03215 [Intestinimonas sp.]
MIKPQSLIVTIAVSAYLILPDGVSRVRSRESWCGKARALLVGCFLIVLLGLFVITMRRAN